MVSTWLLLTFRVVTVALLGRWVPEQDTAPVLKDLTMFGDKIYKYATTLGQLLRNL